MSTKKKKPITKDNFETLLKDLGKEYRRLTKNKMPAEIILVGGGAIMARYGFRELTYDVDAIIKASDAMKDAALFIADQHDIPSNWLNSNFERTESYSEVLREVSKYYRTFSNIVNVRTIEDEYLIAMKLMSGREYKYDLSDIVGILWEHDKIGKPLSREVVEAAFYKLYGNNAKMKKSSKELLDAVYTSNNYKELYDETLANEKQMKTALLDFESNHLKALNEKNIDVVIAQIKEKLVKKQEVNREQAQNKQNQDGQRKKTKNRDSR